MTAGLCLRRFDQGKKPLAAQLLLYPAMYSPTLRPMEDEDMSGYYLQCNGISGFTDHYLPLPNGEALCCSAHTLYPLT
jgi:hypothetical protein